MRTGRIRRTPHLRVHCRQLALLLAGAVACPTTPTAAQPCDRFPFVEVAVSSGVIFQHRTGAIGRRHLPETMGAGVAWIDFDGDGWLDLYFVQSGSYPPGAAAEAGNRLFRNRGNGSFVAVTHTSGASHRRYGQGVLVVDVDGDGFRDLYLTNVGEDTLLLNRGNGTFAEAALPPHDGEGINWGSAAAAADADGDGDLDLYVARYVEYDPENELFCGDAETGRRTYCDPSLFRGQNDRYLRNLGAGTFEDATVWAGLDGARGRGLGVVFVDLDGDTVPDLYVANDLTLNFVYRNRGNGSFEDLSLPSGAAVNREGRPQAGMGVAVGDFDHDGDADLAVTNFDVETNTLYRNDGELLFEDVSAASGFGQPSFNLLGFGLAAADFDGDGHLDIYVANGHIFEQPKRDNVTYRQPDLLLSGDGQGGFVDLSCDWLNQRWQVGRGAAAADFDNDGDIDLAVSNSDAEPSLMRNEVSGGAWLGVELVGRPPNTEAVGALVVLETEGGVQTRWVHAGRSYQSSADRRLLFGLVGGARHLDIRWPTGSRQRIVSPAVGRYLRVVEAHPTAPSAVH